MTPEQELLLSALGAVLFVFTLGAMLWKLISVEDRVEALGEDAELDRRFAIEDRRALLSMVQRHDELMILDEVTPGYMREIVSEWTRPDYRDERIPEPHHPRGFIPW